MTATIELSQDDLRELLAKHFKVLPENVVFTIRPGYNYNQFDRCPESVSASVVVPAARVRGEIDDG